MNAMRAMELTVQMAAQAPEMPSSGPLSYAHIAGMLIRMQEGGFSYGKQCRWLGWAQCALVASGAATLDDMKAINLLCKDDLREDG